MITIIIFSYIGMFITWILYLAVMNIKQNVSTMSWLAKIHAYPLIIIAITFDSFVNIILGTILFLDLPKEWLLTARLKRYIYEENSAWREKIASWICYHLLNQFDPSKKHC